MIDLNIFQTPLILQNVKYDLIKKYLLQGCNRRGGYLAVINSDEEYDIIIQFMRSSHGTNIFTQLTEIDEEKQVKQISMSDKLLCKLFPCKVSHFKIFTTISRQPRN